MLKYGLGRIIDLISTLILRRFQRGVLVGKFVLAWLTTDVSFLPTSHWFIQRYFGTSQQVWDLKYLPHIKEKLNTSKQFQWISLNVPQFVTTPNMIDNYLKVIIFLVNNPYLLHHTYLELKLILNRCQLYPFEFPMAFVLVPPAESDIPDKSLDSLPEKG